MEIFNYMKNCYISVDEESFKFKELICQTFRNEVLTKNFYLKIKTEILNIFKDSKVDKIRNFNESILILFLLNEQINAVWEFIMENCVIRETIFKILSEVLLITITKNNYYKSIEYLEKLIFINKKFNIGEFFTLYNNVSNIISFKSEDNNVECYRFCI